MLHCRCFFPILSLLKYNYGDFITITYKRDDNSKENTSVCCSLLLKELSVKAAAMLRDRLVAQTLEYINVVKSLCSAMDSQMTSDKSSGHCQVQFLVDTRG